MEGIESKQMVKEVGVHGEVMKECKGLFFHLTLVLRFGFGRVCMWGGGRGVRCLTYNTMGV